MKMPAAMKKQAFALLDEVPARHHKVVTMIINVLCANGGKISPQRKLVDLLEEPCKKAEMKPVTEAAVSEYVRKYAHLGLFTRVTNKNEPRSNVLVVSELGKALVAEIKREKIVKANKPAEKFQWTERTLWKVESLLRNKRALFPGMEFPLDAVITEILTKKNVFGLKRMTERKTAERLFRYTLKHRFGSHEVVIIEDTRTVRVNLKLN